MCLTWYLFYLFLKDNLSGNKGNFRDKFFQYFNPERLPFSQLMFSEHLLHTRHAKCSRQMGDEVFLAGRWQERLRWGG